MGKIGTPRKGVNKRHGYSCRGSIHPLYRVWKSMCARCHSPSAEGYREYGARGITVCARWHSAELFMKDMMPKWRRGLTIERVDNNAGYSPDNVIFATRKAQANNRRSSRVICHNGKSMTLAQWGDASGIGIKLLWARLKLGWSFDRAINQPIRK